MRDNMLKIPGIPSNSDEGDLYENIETRPGTTDKQMEAGRCAYTELLEAHARWAGGTLLGCDFPKDFREKGETTFLNQSIKSGHDLAVYLEKIGHANHDLGDLVEKTRRYVKADGYWLLHNHPSGNATPSSQDIRLTEIIASFVPSFKGHVVINTSQYSVIDKDGHVDFVDWMGDQAGGYQNNHYKSHELLLEKIASPEDLAKIGHALKKRDQFFNLIGLSATGFVLSLSELPLSVLNRPQNLLLARLQNFARNSGVNTVFAITNANDYRHPVLSKACEVGILKDVLTVEGSDYRSLREEGLFASLPGEISTIFRKPRTFVKEDGGLGKRKSRTR
jgi:hypothetical protein